MGGKSPTLGGKQVVEMAGEVGGTTKDDSQHIIVQNTEF